MVKYCTVCGSANADNANFCTNCGNKLPSVPNTALLADYKSRVMFESQARRAISIYSLSSIPPLYKSWYEKTSAGLLTKTLVTLFYPILFLGSLGVISPFVPFQIVFLLMFFIISYYFGLVVDNSKLILSLYLVLFFVLGPAVAIIGYNNVNFWVFYVIGFIGGFISISVGRSRRPKVWVSIFCEKKIPQVILSWRHYSHGELGQYFLPMRCGLLSEDSFKKVNKRGRGMGALRVPIINHGGGHGGGGHGGHHGGAHGGSHGGGGGTGGPAVLLGGGMSGRRRRGYGYVKKPLLKVNTDPYEAVAGFVLGSEGVTALLVLKIYYLGQEFNQYNVGVIYDIYLPRSRKLAKTDFMLDFINSIIKGADNFIFVNTS
ncbi:zinc ribbon domain-containing protein [Stygiolobus caldivivus]|uniref:Zinc-ribbon domain-containing protein n=1 Tax=Stygiolobus caldivivus TaxID=2824673 RepID=A0A8D5ZEV5_9CREN|nr:zinc ribbon domain-containing protein [Stygiolobus caldivivus]BCU69898.1 hypothetical protein KN1_11950 [Stygiolobus caldivivus]